MGTRSTEKQKYDRLKQVWDLLGQGKYEQEIVHLMSNEWQCHPRAVYSYLKACKKMIHDKFVSENMDSLIQKYEFLYGDAIKRNDKRLAKSILDSITKFKEGEKIKIEGEVNITGIEINIKR